MADHNPSESQEAWYKRIQKLLGSDETVPDSDTLFPLSDADSEPGKITDTTRVELPEGMLSRAPMYPEGPRPSDSGEWPSPGEIGASLAGSGKPFAPMAMSDFIKEYGGVATQDFASQFPHPFLLQVSQSQSSQKAESGQFRTVALVRRNLGVESEFMRRIVYPLVKRTRGAFDQFLSVGRAVNNDVVIPIKMVSKFHATFECRAGQWLLTDQGSSNGTYLDKRPMAAKQPLEVESGTEIAFSSSTAFVFYDARRLHTLMKMLKDKAES